MARYIDADALKLDIDLSKGASVLDMAINVIKAVKDAPTADVVPKSEVDNLKVLLEMQEKTYESLKELYDMDTEALVNARKKTEVEVAREIFEEIDRVVEDAELEWGTICGVKLCVAELKKKYIGGIIK